MADVPLIGRRQREIWAEERARLGLEPGSPAFGRAGLMRRLNGQSVQVVLLPPDPLAPTVDFDEDLAAALPDRFTGQFASSIVQLLGMTSASADHVLRVSQGDESGHRAFLALSRNGGVSVGLADKPGYFLLRNHDDQRVMRLAAVSSAVRLALAAQAKAALMLAEAGSVPDGPWEAVVALPGAKGSWLGMLAEGWADPEHAFDVNVCEDDDPLVRVELPRLPRDANEAREVLTTTLGRVVNAFGATQPLHVRPGSELVADSF